MSKPDGGQAFPGPLPMHVTNSNGMTLRDYFAGQAMVGLLASRHPDHFGEEGAAQLAEDAYATAEHMLKMRAEWGVG